MIDKKNPLDKIRNQTLALNYAPVVRRNLESGELRFPMVDIYVNDICNLHCEFCPTIFGRNNLPIEAIPLIAPLHPSVITLTGGGEPSIYRSGKSRIEDFISRIRSEMGQVPLGMMTNGVSQMPPEAVNELSWLRVSLNASTQPSYSDVHRRDKFFAVLENLVAYLKMNVEKVGIGFVYTPKTLYEIVEFANVISKHVLPYINDDEKKKLTLQFRPVADGSYKRYSIDNDQKSNLSELIEQLSKEARDLLEQQSNINEVIDNRCFALQARFNGCYVSLLQMNIDAKGDAYPCPQKAHKYEDTYGNIFEQDFHTKLKEKVMHSFEIHTCNSCPTCAQTKINKEYSETDLTATSFDKPIPPVFF